jgi:hypothetical protein
MTVLVTGVAEPFLFGGCRLGGGAAIGFEEVGLAGLGFFAVPFLDGTEAADGLGQGGNVAGDDVVVAVEVGEQGLCIPHTPVQSKSRFEPSVLEAIAAAAGPGRAEL